MRKFYYFCTLLCISSIVHAQEQTISGKVTDGQNNSPLAGVTVAERNGANITATQVDGTYSINVKNKNVVLLFSYSGYATIEIPLEGRSTVDVTMKPENKSLQEVYVVAYGNQTRRNATSAVSVVNSDQIKRQQVTTVTQALQGTAPGVLVINTSGQPGENPQIRIRGIASINASAEPLIVVDGVPFGGNLAMINPNDVDNFSVLKDATATALYGSRAANGVILINTKSGKKDSKPRITLNATAGWSSRALPEYDFVTMQQLMELNWEGLRNLNADAGVPNPEQQATNDLIPEHLYYNPYIDPQPVGIDGKLKAGLTPVWSTDWKKELTRNTAKRRDVNLGISGGANNNSYYFGLGYLGHEGYVVTSQFKRISTRFNFNSEVNKWLTLGVRTQYVYSDQNFPDQTGSDYENVIQYIRQMSSIFPVYKRDDDGKIINDAQGNPIYDFGNPDPSHQYNQNRQVLQPSNLVATTFLNTERRQRHMTTLNGFAELKFAPVLRFRSNFGVDRYTYDQLAYENPMYGNGASVGGRLRRVMEGTTSWTWNNMLTYKQKFGEHNVEVMASAEMYHYQLQDLDGQKTRFPIAGLYEFNTAANTEGLKGFTNNLAIESYLSRIKYDFKNRYFIEATVRWDGSSRFSKDYRWGFFPAVGVSWVISDEPFMQRLSEKMGLLKLRASYGRVGNEALASYFPYISTFSPGSSALGIDYSELDQPGFILDQLANKEIRWESQQNFNVGVDFSLFDNRLSGSLDYFNKGSLDLLFRKPLVLSGGIQSIDFNIGDVVNRGVELNLNAAIVKHKNFGWDIGFNITKVKNILKKLPQNRILNGRYQQEVGKSIYEFYLAEWAGVDPQDGAGMWYKDEMQNGQPTGKKITTKSFADATRYYQGTSIPAYTGGITTRVTYKGFDFSVLFNYALGGKYYDDNYTGILNGIASSAGSQMSADILSRWQKPGDITNVPRLDINNNDYLQNSTRFLFKGDYARVRNITLGYKLKPAIKNNVIESVRLYVQGDNLFTFSRLKRGADPETDINGQAGGSSSVFKILSAGVEVTF